MKTYTVPGTDLEISRIAFGCMRSGGSWDDSPVTHETKSTMVELVNTAVDAGINLFDHADIYARGKSEEAFAEALRSTPGLRDGIVLQSKCGIRPGDPGRYDLSYDHIIHSVDGILARLQTDRLDVLELHRPDPLIEPEEVARAFDTLHAAGKVRYFGVSNHSAGQIALLQQALDHRLVFNQLGLNLLHAYLIDEGVLVNDGGETALASGILDYCRQKEIMIQAYSPLAGGRLFDPPADAEERVLTTAARVAKMAAEKDTSREAIVLAWLLRHPAGIQPIIGTTNPDRIRQCCLADDITLSREEWYALYVAGRGGPLP